MNDDPDNTGWTFGTPEQVAATRIKPPEQPWPEQDIPYLAWDNYTRGFAAGVAYQKAKQVPHEPHEL